MSTLQLVCFVLQLARKLFGQILALLKVHLLAGKPNFFFC